METTSEPNNTFVLDQLQNYSKVRERFSGCRSLLPSPFLLQSSAWLPPWFLSSSPSPPQPSVCPTSVASLGKRSPFLLRCQRTHTLCVQTLLLHLMHTHEQKPSGAWRGATTCHWHKTSCVFMKSTAHALQSGLYNPVESFLCFPRAAHFIFKSSMHLFTVE